jgi:recombinational DNA repair protein (RecF pathway)
MRELKDLTVLEVRMIDSPNLKPAPQRCQRCHRTLKSAAAMQAGFGHVCLKKMAAEAKKENIPKTIRFPKELTQMFERAEQNDRENYGR